MSEIKCPCCEQLLRVSLQAVVPTAVPPRVVEEVNGTEHVYKVNGLAVATNNAINVIKYIRTNWNMDLKEVKAIYDARDVVRADFSQPCLTKNE